MGSFVRFLNRHGAGLFALLAFIAASFIAPTAGRTLAQNSPVRPAAQSPARAANAPSVPNWALPASPTHRQVAPPKDFHRPMKTFPGKIGIFSAQSDIGGPLLPGSASYDPATGVYTVNSAGYNIWYTRDEFRYLWKKMSGDVSFAANVGFPVPENPPRDRKVVMVIRQDLDDNAKEVMAAEHGTGMVHLAERRQKGAFIEDMEYSIASRSGPNSTLATLMPQRIGIEKRGNSVSLWISVNGEPMHQFGPPVKIHFDGPFYVGIGFCSHNPTAIDTGTFSHVVLKNAASQVR